MLHRSLEKFTNSNTWDVTKKGLAIFDNIVYVAEINRTDAKEIRILAQRDLRK